MSVQDHLSAARHELLDLGLRNPLLNYRTTKARGLDIVGEAPAELARILVDKGRTMTFLAAPEREEPGETANENGEFVGDLAALLANLDPDGGSESAQRHTDSRLQTPYTPAKLQSRLLATFYAARTFVEERGANVLYLALGMLEWVQESAPDKLRRAPLLLIPVELTRSDARARFRLESRGEDIGGNLTLQSKLKGEFGLSIDLPDPEADLDVPAYFAHVAEIVSETPGFRVDDAAVHLGFFQFGKLLMYNDLQEDAWPEDSHPADHPIVGALLGGGFAPPADRIGDDEHLDQYLDLDDVYQVVDADGSQTLALLDIKGGHNLVIQGPPGTGKSQTITNVIAEAVGQGKTVLFVAEKMAALDVVKRRLDAAELGDACLELHSHKTNKKELLAGLERTLRLGKPVADVLKTNLAVLVDARDQLNEYAEAVNAEVRGTGFTPHVAYGHSLELAERWSPARSPAATDSAMLDWSRSDYERRRARVEAMQGLVVQIGRPADHPFFGSRRTSVLPSELPEIAGAARDLGSALDSLEDAADATGQSLRLKAASPEDAHQLAEAGRRALTAPDLTGARVDTDAWRSQRSEISDILTEGQAYADLRARHESSLIPDAWDADLLGTRQHLAAHGETWYRFLIGDWRRAKVQLSGLMTGPLPAGASERVELVDAVLQAQRLRRDIRAFATRGTDLFGQSWVGEKSSWSALQRVADWLADLYTDVEGGYQPAELIDYLADAPDLGALNVQVRQQELALVAFAGALAKMIGSIQFDAKRFVDAGVTLTAQPFGTIRQLADGWAENTHRLQEMVSFNVLANQMADDELILFAGISAEWGGGGEHLTDLFDYVWFNTMLDEAYGTRPALAGFNGALHAEAARRFVDKDEISLLYNRARLALRHWQDLPRRALGDRTSGQLGVLQHQFSLTRRRMPIRKLMERAGLAVQAIKPVFMMSPLSVAAYLPPGALEFDLVVFDEASQVKPVDAFGALLRGRQAVVVGDSKQLPPTSFFDTVLYDDDVDDDETGAPTDIESVLELFKSKQAPERMLRWHYRSRHESLIAVSNAEFYDNKLVTFPSPDAERTGVGLAYHHLPDALYDRGGSRTNREEARAVARAVAAHAAQNPHLSLMVATFSQAQQKEVRDQVDLLSLADPVLSRFVNRTDTYERFDVKNLENVQGDERDVVFISVGYGRDTSGSVAMNFGPLNQDGGERRLNVLISRARRRCEVFTNLRPEDIDLSRTQSTGVAVFKRYLQFAESGRFGPAAATAAPGPGRPFEDVVAEALRARGYTVETQVGVGAFRIDLAIVDPVRAGRFVLGIECDGASYNRARTARDRDRIRQSVLEDLGWRIHRIWSTDWFRAPADELARSISAIETALANPVEPDVPAEAVPVPALRRSSDPAPTASPPTSEPYRLARVAGLGGSPDDVPAPKLARVVTKIVHAESPLHVDELARRILHVSSAVRMGSRIADAIDAARETALHTGEVEQRGDFLYTAGQDVADVIVRDRSNLPPASRAFDFIAPEEVRAAISEVLSESYGIGADELAPEVCRMLGFGQTSSQMRVSIDGALADMQTSGTVSVRGGVLTLTPLNATDYDALV